MYRHTSNIHYIRIRVLSHSHVQTNLIFILLKFKQTKKKQQASERATEQANTFGVKIVRVEQMMNRLGVN